MQTPFTPPPRFAVISGIARLTKTHRVVAMRLVADGTLKPAGHVVGSSGNPRPVFDLASAVETVRAAVRRRVGAVTPSDLVADRQRPEAITPRELAIALASPITPEAHA